MTLEITCPVCQREHINEKQERCPQCDSDLTCFRVLEELPEPISPPTPGIPHHQANTRTDGGKRWTLLTITAGMWGFFVIFLLGWQLYRLNDLKSYLGQRESAFHATISGFESRLSVISGNQDKMLDRAVISEKPAAMVQQPVKKESEQPRASAHADPDMFYNYQASNTDTLWRLAERFYGSGFYFPVILTHNPEVGIYALSGRDRLAILKDPKRAKDLYKEITEIKNGCLYWYYTVRPGDTPASINSRYCLLADCPDIPSTQESQANFSAGQTIQIRLTEVLK